MGGCTALADSAWRWLQLPVDKPWSMRGEPFVCFHAQTGVEKCSLHLVGTPLLAFLAAFSPEKRSLVRGSQICNCLPKNHLTPNSLPKFSQITELYVILHDRINVAYILCI